MEGRYPSPQFDTKGYPTANAGVKAAGVPLAHVLLWGEQEARHVELPQVLLWL